VTGLHRRVVALERRTIPRGPWSDEVEEELRSLKREARERAEMRKALTEVLARFWELMGDSERAAAIRAHGVPEEDLSILRRPEVRAALQRHFAEMAPEDRGTPSNPHRREAK
jgi:hypothetical protein